jgi:hypothetical protein
MVENYSVSLFTNIIISSSESVTACASTSGIETTNGYLPELQFYRKMAGDEFIIYYLFYQLAFRHSLRVLLD